MSVGESLARAREERGLSVDDVAQATRIRGTVIRAIERDEFDVCGGTVYARGHIRSIAHVVGSDPDPLIADFDASHGGPPAGPAPTQVFDPEVHAVAERRRPNWSAAMALALVAVSVLAAVRLFGGSDSPRRPSDLELAGGPPATSTSSAPRPTSTPPSTIARIPQDRVTVLMRITGAASWCSVTTSTGKVLFEGTLTAGQQKTFTDDKQLKLVLGNAAAVHLVVNGRDLGVPGAAGQVMRIAFGPGDPAGTGGQG